MGNVYTSPYAFDVNGIGTYYLICDDFTTDISFGYQWDANVSNLSSIVNNSATPTSTKFTSGGVVVPDTTPDYTGSIGGVAQSNITIQEKYDAAGLLAESLFTELLQHPSNAVAIGEYSYAIWQIFDPQAYLGYPIASGSVDSSYVGTITTPGTITNLEYNALAEAVSGVKVDSSLELFTPSDPTNHPSQEFIGFGTVGIQSVPEASSVTFILLDLLVLSAIALFARRGLRANRSN
jgi:hypothetical protein